MSKTKVRAFLFAMLLAVLPGLVLTAVSTAQDVVPIDPIPAAAAQQNGINVDGYFPASLDPICGLRIVLYGSKPVSFYNSGRNPWGPPTVQEWPYDGSGTGIWIITFGDGTGPCFPRSHPVFWGTDGSGNPKFLGLHFGFYTDDPATSFVDADGSNSPCWYRGANGWVPCTGIVGYRINGGVLNVLNANDQVFAVRNAEVAVVDDLIPIDDLTRHDLQHLEWEPLPVEDDAILPAASGDEPGTLAVVIPDHILGSQGWAVVSYDIASPETGEVFSTVTLEFPLGAAGE